MYQDPCVATFPSGIDVWPVLGHSGKWTNSTETGCLGLLWKNTSESSFLINSAWRSLSHETQEKNPASLELVLWFQQPCISCVLFCVWDVYAFSFVGVGKSVPQWSVDRSVLTFHLVWDRASLVIFLPLLKPALQVHKLLGILLFLASHLTNGSATFKDFCYYRLPGVRSRDLDSGPLHSCSK